MGSVRGFVRKTINGVGPLFCVALISVVIFASAMHAQSSSHTGRLQGVVTDQSGAVIPGAEIKLVKTATGAEEAKTTGADGSFVFPALEPGKYQVTVFKAGFAPMEFTDVQINVGTTATIQPALAIAPVQQETTVVASPPDSVGMVDTSTSAVSMVISERSIGVLPLNGRNFTDFALLTPGAKTDGDFGMISFNGVAGNYNNYTVDGANDNNAFYAQQIGRTSIPFQFSEDVIQEFQVTSTGFEAEFGQAGGGLVNTVTKSGTNNFHAHGYYYILDSSLNANDSINKRNAIAKPDNRRQQFGATVGGPIRREHLFYVANYEGQVRSEPLVVNNAPAHLDQLPPGFFAANPALQQAVLAASGIFPRSFNQNSAFVKLNGTLNDRNTFTATSNSHRFVTPHTSFLTPPSTGDGLSLTDT